MSWTETVVCDFVTFTLLHFEDAMPQPTGHYRKRNEKKKKKWINERKVNHESAT
jgi:hypothetical protein